MYVYEKERRIYEKQIKKSFRGGGNRLGTSLQRGAKVGRHSNIHKKSAFTLSEGDTYVAHFDKSRRVAFTLAEVLITLGIIGVVAALTIPNLIAKYQKHEGIIGYKKMLSTLNQASSKIVADLGYLPECYRWADGASPYPAMNECLKRDDKGSCMVYGDDKDNPRPSDYSGKNADCGLYQDKLFKEMKVIKSCNKAYFDGCTPEYKGSDTLLKEADDSLTEEDLLAATDHDTGLRAANLKKAPAKVFADGTIYVNLNSTVIVIDVNGQKGPNKWGYDVFRISLNGAPTKGLFYTCENMPVEKGGIHSCHILMK